MPRSCSVAIVGFENTGYMRWCGIVLNEVKHIRYTPLRQTMQGDDIFFRACVLLYAWGDSAPLFCNIDDRATGGGDFGPKARGPRGREHTKLLTIETSSCLVLRLLGVQLTNTENATVKVQYCFILICFLSLFLTTRSMPKHSQGSPRWKRTGSRTRYLQ